MQLNQNKTPLQLRIAALAAKYTTRKVKVANLCFGCGKGGHNYAECMKKLNRERRPFFNESVATLDVAKSDEPAQLPQRSSSSDLGSHQEQEAHQDLNENTEDEQLKKEIEAELIEIAVELALQATKKITMKLATKKRQ